MYIKIIYIEFDKRFIGKVEIIWIHCYHRSDTLSRRRRETRICWLISIKYQAIRQTKEWKYYFDKLKDQAGNIVLPLLYRILFFTPF